MELSVIIPAYNEERTIREIIRKVKEARPFDKEIIVIDDCSRDRTPQILRDIHEEGVSIYFHRKNMGKGAAIRTGLSHAKGDIVVIQDADLEYDPRELIDLIKPIQDGIADAVYGTRLTGGKPQRVHMFWHKVANTYITLFANLLFNTTMTDVTTCYKAFRRDFIKDFTIRTNDWAIECELTAKVLKKGGRLYETPISYYGRGYKEGKKIRFYHAFGIIWALLKFRFTD